MEQTFKIEEMHKAVSDLILNASGEKITGKMVIDASNALLVLTQAASETVQRQAEVKALKAQNEAQAVTIKSLEEESKKR